MEKFQSHAVTLTLIGQCPMSNSSELFSYTTICSSLKWIEPLFFELSCTQTDTQTHTHTDTHTAKNVEAKITTANMMINHWKNCTMV